MVIEVCDQRRSVLSAYAVSSRCPVVDPELCASPAWSLATPTRGCRVIGAFGPCRRRSTGKAFQPAQHRLLVEDAEAERGAAVGVNLGAGKLGLEGTVAVETLPVAELVAVEDLGESAVRALRRRARRAELAVEPCPRPGPGRARRGRPPRRHRSAGRGGPHAAPAEPAARSP